MAQSSPLRKELKVFERLETMTNHESFDSAATFVRKFIQGNLDLNNTYQSILEDDDDDEEEESEEVGVKDLIGDQVADRGQQEAAVQEGKMSSNLHVNQSETNQESEDENEDCGSTSYRNFVEREAGIADEDEDDYENFSQSDEGSESSDEEDFIEGLQLKQSTAYLLLSEMKRSLELQELQLERERQAFTQEKSSEQQHLQEEKKGLETKKKNLESLVTSYHKMKAASAEQETKVKDLTEKLRQTKLEMNKRINRWGDQQRRLEERVIALEKENADLKKQKSVQYRPSNLKRPSTLATSSYQQNGPKKSSINQQPRKIHFEDEDKKRKNTSTVVGQTEKKIHNFTPQPDSNDELCPKSDKLESNPENSLSDSVATISCHAPNLDEIDNTNNLPAVSVSKGPPPPNAQSNPREISLDDVDADRTMPSDYVEVVHPCGTITRVCKTGGFTRHIMANKDILDELEDCSVRYYYAELGFSQITYPNGDEIIEYDSGVIETQRADGTKILTFADGLVKLIDPLNREEVYFPDGSVMKKDGVESTVIWPSGQKEIRTPGFVKRIYTNGTVKIRYSDGSEETQYWNGRVRRKDKNGMLVDDTKKKRKKKNEVNDNE